MIKTRERKTAVISLILLILPLFLLSIISIVFFLNYANENLRESIESKIEGTDNQIFILYQDLNNLSNYIGNLPSTVSDIKALLREGNATQRSFTSYEFLRHIIVTNLASDTRSIPIKKSIYVYFPNDAKRFISSDIGLTDIPRYYDQTWYQPVLDNKTPFYHTELRQIQQFEFSEPQNIISISSLLPYAGLEVGSGIIVLNINQKNFEESIDPTITILSDGFPIIHNDRFEMVPSSVMSDFLNSNDRSLSIRIEKKNLLLTKSENARFGLQYVSIEDRRILFRLPSIIIYITILLCLLIMFIGSIISYRLQKMNQLTIQRIHTLFDQADKGLPIKTEDHQKNTQYNIIIHNIISNFVENNYLKVQLAKRKYQGRTLELLALQNQLNPHFLFNTLDSINWRILAVAGASNPATAMIEDLATILKYSFTGSSEVSLHDEISCIEHYIKIQRFRYKDKFTYSVSIDPGAQSAAIPKMFLQPIIENSIYHGIKLLKNKGIIKVLASMSGNSLTLKVIDNGPGFSEEKKHTVLHEINQLEQSSSHLEESGHIGLVNTFRRLTLFFAPEKCSISINSSPYRETEIVFTFPYRAFPPE